MWCIITCLINNFSSSNVNFHLNHLVTIKTKQEGEECGSCFSPDTNYFCGSCAPGLECLKDTASKLLPDAPSRCKKKPGNLLII